MMGETISIRWNKLNRILRKGLVKMEGGNGAWLLNGQVPLRLSLNSEGNEREETL